MFVGESARRFKSALRRAGERVTVRFGDKVVSTRAVLQNTGKNFMRKYDSETERKPLGVTPRRDKLAFLPYLRDWETYNGRVIVTWRHKRYAVIADSVMYLRDEPVYIWAVMTEINKGDESYYDDIG